MGYVKYYSHASTDHLCWKLVNIQTVVNYLICQQMKVHCDLDEGCF